MLDLVFVALVQAAAGTPATPAEDPQTESVQVTTDQPQEQPRRVCRRVRETGSRLGVRVCRDGGAEELGRQDRQHILDQLGAPVFDRPGDGQPAGENIGG
jgi:hypothetical protein